MQPVDSVVFTAEKYKPYFAFWKQFLEKGIDTFSYQQVRSINTANSLNVPLRHSFELSPKVTRQLLTVVNNQETGVMVIMMAAISVVLSKYAEQDYVIINTPTLDLKSKEKKFVERVPVIIKLDENKTFRELLISLQQNIQEFYKYQNFPLSLINYVVSDSQEVYSSNILFEYEGLHENKSDSDSSALKISARRTDDSIWLSLELDSSFFDVTFGENFFSHVNYALGYLDNLDTSLKDIVLTPGDKHIQLLRQFNMNDTFKPLQTTLVDSFEAQVRSTPDKAALEFLGRELSYSELNHKANCLASYIRSEYDIKNGELIGIMVDRSDDLIISILGVLKAGGTYVPIDSGYPAERKAYFLEDTKLRVLITSSEYLFSLPAYSGDVIAIDVQMPSVNVGVENLNFHISPEQPAYVIYTSGSTGKPKGVVVSHKGCLNMVGAQIAEFEMSEGDVTLQFSSVSFDASVSEIFKTLLAGAKLVMMDKRTSDDPEKLVSFMKEKGVTVVTIPPSYLNVVPIEQLRFLRMIISAGEAANIRHATEFSKFGTYYNAYGPTECSVCVSIEKFNPAQDESRLPIGRPIANTTVHLLTRSGHLSPLGLPGEICVSGKGVALGYLNAPELTVEKFVRHPDNPSETLYRTGDVGRWLPDGRLEFMGRKDSQIKVRGYRIELLEIEHCARKHKYVTEAVCVLREDKNQEKQIVLYFTATDDLRAAELRKYMEIQLPNYMLPAHFAKINAFHFLPSGKVNRKILPEVSTLTTESDYVEPKTEIEIKLAGIWAKNLDRQRVGIHDNFFAIGGDSIKAIRLAVEMNKATGLKIEVNDIFTYSTINLLINNVLRQEIQTSSMQVDAEMVIQQFRKDILSNKAFQLPSDVEDVIPMSDIQKGMIFHSLVGAKAGLYKEQMYFQLKDASYNGSVFNDAVNLMAKKHAILRTSFIMEEGISAQIIHKFKYRSDNLVFEDISEKTREDQKRYLQQILLEDKYKHLDIKNSMLWKVHSFKLSADDYGIMFSCNHAIVDGWSNASLMTELSHAYFSLKDGRQYSVEPLKASYRDYIIDQIRVSNNVAIRDFWRTELKEYVKAPLPFNRSITSAEHKVCNFTYELPERLTSDMNGLAGLLGISLKHIFLSAFGFLLKLVTGGNDLTFGLVTNSRPELEDGEKIIGCFTNTVPFRIKVKPGVPASAFINSIDTYAKKLKAFDKLSLIEIMKAIEEETTSGNPIFDIIFNYVDFHIYEKVHGDSDVSDGIIDEQPRGNTNTFFDFTVCKSDRNRNKFIVNLNYHAGLYTLTDIDRLFDYYTRILSLIVYQNNEVLSPISIITERELEDIYKINECKQPVREATVVELFEQQVNKNPDKVAVVYREIRLTYRELNEKANTLASYLRLKHHVKPNDLVGVMMERSALAMVAILGVLKAGGAYVPIGVYNPLERKKQLLDETGVNILITESDLMFSALEYYNGEIIALDIQLDELDSHTENGIRVNAADDLAYIMFTSGSTGKPKGVMIEHKSVVNLVENPNFIELTGDENLLQTGSISFDATTFEYWSTLLHGGTLHIVDDEDLLNVGKLKSIIINDHISIMWLTAALFNQLADADIEIFKSLKYLLVGGDRLSPEHIRRLKDRHRNLIVVNGYGPTEATTFSLCYNIHNTEGNSIPIGMPVQNLEVFLLDADCLPVPKDVKGEICIGGAGLARGYWKNPDLTRERFANVCINGINKRLYRTGDFGKLLKNNVIDFLGRNDCQVKINGYRVELGEIEEALRSYEDVNDAKAVIRNNGNGSKEIVAYVVGENTLDGNDLRSFLKKRLPEYMCPATISCLAEFPLTIHGKIDLKKLPASENTLKETDDYEAPSTDVEQIMQTVWESVLGKKRIGVNDNFFMIGGDSIKAIQVSSRMQREGYMIEVKDIFTYPVISQLSREAKRITREIDQSMVSGEVPLTPIQINFFDQKRSNPSYFNQSVLLKPSYRLNEADLERVFNKLIQHHDILRAVFTRDTNGSITQYIKPIGEVIKIRVEEMVSATNAGKLLEQLCCETQESINIHDGPLINVVLVHMDDSDRLLIVVHHLIVDGVSWRILLEDIETLLKQCNDGADLLLSPKTDSYLAWSEALVEYVKSPKAKAEADYWLTFLRADFDNAAQVTTGSNKIKDASLECIEIDEENTSLFLSNVHQAFNTKSNDILLSALGRAFSRTFGWQSALIAMEGHGREMISNDIDISRTVGWFTSIFPVLLSGLNQPRIDKLIKETKENLNSIPSKGVGYGILKYLDKSQTSDFSKLNPTVSFNYLGQFDVELANTSFTLAPEPSGYSVDINEARIYDLDITGMVLNNKLKFNVSFNPNHYESGVMDTFCQALKRATIEIIQYCADRKQSELTPSDLTHKKISADVLDSIRQMI